MLEIGDVLVQHDPINNQFHEVNIESIETIDETRTVYEFDAAPHDILIAGNIVVHNLKAF